MIDGTTITQAVIVLALALAAYLRSKSTQTKVDQAKTTGAENADKLDTIHDLVNSRLTQALDDIATLRTYITSNAKPGDPPIPPTAAHP